jgi:hypothetical protein
MAAALPFISAGFAVIGALQQAGAASDAASYNQKVAQQNATIATQQGAADVAENTNLNYLKLSTIQAQQGANGSGGGGSALDLLGSSAAQAELENQNIRYNASLKALGYTNQANLDGSQASNAATGGIFSAAANGLTSYGNFLKTSGAAGSGTVITSGSQTPPGYSGTQL